MTFYFHGATLTFSPAPIPSRLRRGMGGTERKSPSHVPEALRDLDLYPGYIGSRIEDRDFDVPAGGSCQPISPGARAPSTGARASPVSSNYTRSPSSSQEGTHFDWPLEANSKSCGCSPCSSSKPRTCSSSAGEARIDWPVAPAALTNSSSLASPSRANPIRLAPTSWPAHGPADRSGPPASGSLPQSGPSRVPVLAYRPRSRRQPTPDWSATPSVGECWSRALCRCPGTCARRTAGTDRNCARRA